MPSRRTVLRASGAGAALLVGGLAGCTRRVRRVVNGAPPAYTDWLYDPRTVLPVERHAFGSLDVEHAYGNRDRLPEPLVERIRRIDRLVESVDVTDLTRLTAVAYGRPARGRGGGSVAVEGSFDPGAIVAELRDRVGRGERGLAAAGTYRGYRLYEYAPDYLGRFVDAPEGTTASLGVGLHDEALIVGGLVAAEAVGLDAVRAAVAADAAGRARYYETNADARTVVDALEGATFAAGVAFPPDATGRSSVPAAWETIRAVVEDLNALGFGTTLGDEEATTRFVLVYDAAAAADPETVRTLLDRFRERGGGDIENVSVSQDGRAVLVTTRTDTDALYEQYRTGSAGTAAPD